MHIKDSLFSAMGKPSLLPKLKSKNKISYITGALFMVLFAAVGVRLLSSGQASTGPAADSDKMIGINGSYSVDSYVLDARNLGVKWMRVDQWGDNASYDTVPNTLNRLGAQNIRMLPLVNNYNVSWVTSTGKQQWVDQVVHTAITYGKGGTWWNGKTDLGSPVIEVANEAYGNWYPWPDQGFIKPGEYTKMIKQAAVAVNTATNGRVKLIMSASADYLDTNDFSGGSSGTWKNWARESKLAVPDIESYIAGIAAHPYGDIPQIGIGTDTSINDSHQVLYTLHSQWNVPVYVTEVGQKGPKVGFAQQAAAMNYYFDELKNNNWEVGLFWYNQKDWEAYDPNADNGWALIDYQDNRQPAWTTYQQRATSFVQTGTPPPPPPAGKPGDVDGNGSVNILDLRIIGKNWGQSGRTKSQGDLDGNGTVNIFDLRIIGKNWGM